MVQEVEITNIDKHRTELVEEFRTYTETIQPLIINIEEMTSTFPVEILNEIRAMYTHLSRAYLAEQEKDVVSNIEKIKRHTKRALLDCYKNSCIIAIDQRDFFFKKYKGIDLTYIDQGEFLKDEKEKYSACIEALKIAKQAEGMNTGDAKLFSLYEDAYKKALILESIISAAEGKADFLRKKALKRDILAYVFGIVGVIGTIFTIVTWLIK